MLSGVGGSARLPGCNSSVLEDSGMLEPPNDGVSVSWAVTSTGWLPVLRTVIAPSHRALAREDPSDGRESAMREADSTSDTLTPDRDIWLLLESVSVEDGSHDAVISYPVPDNEDASQYITLLTWPPGLMLAGLMSTKTPLTSRVIFPSAVDPP